jgi:hypothetical protein
MQGALQIGCVTDVNEILSPIPIGCSIAFD